MVHVVLDNNSYGSCSEERTASADANIGLVAALQGYARVIELDAQEDLADAIAGSAAGEGPTLVHARTALGGRRDFKRPMDLGAMAERFRDYFSDAPAAGGR